MGKKRKKKRQKQAPQKAAADPIQQDSPNRGIEAENATDVQETACNPSEHVEKEPEGQKGFLARNGKLAAFLLVVALAVGVCTWMICSIAFPVETYSGGYDPETQVNETVQIVHEGEDVECQHSWREDYSLVHHDAVTRSVEHPATYRQVEIEHTVCNTCGQVIDGQTAEHAAATGHEGYTTGVPVSERVLETAAWTETVTDSPAYDELVYAGQVCNLCGEQNPLEAPAQE